MLADNYFGSTGDIGIGVIPSVYLQTNAPSTVSANMAWDAQFSYTLNQAAAGNLWSLLKGLKVTLGVNNLGNKMPPSCAALQSHRLLQQQRRCLHLFAHRPALVHFC